MRFVVMLASVLIASSQAQSAEDSNWKISYFPNDAKPAGCIMTGDYQSGSRLGIVINTKYEWGMTVSNPAWKLKVDEKFDVAVAVDNKLVGTGRYFNISTTTAYIPFSGADAFKALQMGHQLTITTQIAKISFALPGTSKAMYTTMDCVKTIGLNATNNQAAPKSNFEMLSQAETTTILANLLASAGASGYKIDKPKQKGSGASYISGDGTKGFLHIARGNTRQADDYAAYVISQSSAGCRGQFLSGKEVVPSTDGSIVRKVITTCRDSGSELIVESTIVRRPDGYLLHLGNTVPPSNSASLNPQPPPKDRAAMVDAAMRWSDRP
jgi:hypothetical protein